MGITKDFKLLIMTGGRTVAVLVSLFGAAVQTLLPSKPFVPNQLAFNATVVALTFTASWWAYHVLASVSTIETLFSLTIARSA